MIQRRPWSCSFLYTPRSKSQYVCCSHDQHMISREGHMITVTCHVGGQSCDQHMISLKGHMISDMSCGGHVISYERYSHVQDPPTHKEKSLMTIEHFLRLVLVPMVISLLSVAIGQGEEAYPHQFKASMVTCLHSIAQLCWFIQCLQGDSQNHTQHNPES